MNLKQARQQAGLTVAQITDKANVSRATYNNAERGISIRIEYANRIVNAINDLAGTQHTVTDLHINVTD